MGDRGKAFLVAFLTAGGTVQVDFYCIRCCATRSITCSIGCIDGISPIMFRPGNEMDVVGIGVDDSVVMELEIIPSGICRIVHYTTLMIRATITTDSISRIIGTTHIDDIPERALSVATYTPTIITPDSNAVVSCAICWYSTTPPADIASGFRLTTSEFLTLSIDTSIGSVSHASPIGCIWENMEVYDRLMLPEKKIVLGYMFGKPIPPTYRLSGDAVTIIQQFDRKTESTVFIIPHIYTAIRESSTYIAWLKANGSSITINTTLERWHRDGISMISNHAFIPSYSATMKCINMTDEISSVTWDIGGIRNTSPLINKLLTLVKISHQKILQYTTCVKTVHDMHYQLCTFSIW